MPQNELSGRKIHIQGIVQGVGFRPFVYTQATKRHLTGWVRNSSAGVDILVNGPQMQLDAFLGEIQGNPPPLAKIDSIDVQSLAPDTFVDFQILESAAEEGGFIPISPDISICPDCLRELFDPADRRYRYPFINCTNCGPRFTIIKDIPYDRPLTTMDGFKLCARCEHEYRDPSDRRFHAQPVACADCGPQVWFEARGESKTTGEEAIQTTRRWLKQGKIVAIKGLGGFHLACDATNPSAIDELRRRKHRSEKSFALMVFDASIAAQYCRISPAERALLESKEKPIVILERKPDCPLPAQIAPDLRTLGVMLPYTPLHYLLLEPEEGYQQAWIMTSGNLSEEPIAYANSTALSELGEIADGFLLNDRDIQMRVDDSVLAEYRGAGYFFRRSRGFAPNPIRCAQPLREVLAVGAELKNTFCLTKGSYAFLSHHIGDLENTETLHAFESGIPHYEHIFKVDPIAIARDLHPDYLSSRYAINRAQSQNLPLIEVQHHHAHLAACLADNGWQQSEPVIGAIFDGTGLGTDGKIWGGEFLVGDYAGYFRPYHLAYYPLPGGDAAVRQPKRLAAAYLRQAGILWDESLPPFQAMDEPEQSVLLAQLEKGINTPFTSSMGRLFDAAASLIGLRHVIHYEAQAAIELENCAEPSASGDYAFDVRGDVIDPAPLLAALAKDVKNQVPADVLAARFHRSVAGMVLQVCRLLRTQTGTSTVALSGGVWQNMLLLRQTGSMLKEDGFSVLTHRQTPPNDGCIALGQAMIANQQLK